jgi:acetamidase/formamidase
MSREHSVDASRVHLDCSLAGDLHIHEIVDAGVSNVGMTLPLGVFAEG